jgi:hypothetical protein
MRFFLAAISFSFIMLLQAPAQAQSTYIAGIPVYCRDANSVPVATVAAPYLQDVGMANITNGWPVIFLNPNVLSMLPPQIQLFWYAHECAHHVLGHALGPPRFTREIEADCWAIKTGRDQGWFTENDLQTMYIYFINNPGSPWGHLPGPDRLELFEECYYQP